MYHSSMTLWAKQEPYGLKGIYPRRVKPTTELNIHCFSHFSMVLLTSTQWEGFRLCFRSIWGLPYEGVNYVISESIIPISTKFCVFIYNSSMTLWTKGEPHAMKGVYPRRVKLMREVNAHFPTFLCHYLL